MAINRWNRIDRINRSRFSSQTGYLALFNGSFNSEDEVYVSGSAATVTADPDAVVSDDFGAGSLNAMWTYDGTVSGSADVDEAGDEKYCEISVPAGGVNAYGTLTAPHIIQAYDGGDFDITVKNLTEPTGDNADQGIIIKLDDDNYIRLDTYHNGTNLMVFVGVIAAGVGSTKVNTIISSGDADYLRITKSGTTYTFYRSADGETWTNLHARTETMAVTDVGIFASSSSLAYTAQFDYFFDTNNPIENEDTSASRVVASGRSIAVGVASASVTFDRMAIMDALTGGNQVDTLLLPTARTMKSGDTLNVVYGIVSIT